MFLHLNVVILTAKDAGRLLAISGQKRKQTLTRFYPTKTSGWYLYSSVARGGRGGGGGAIAPPIGMSTKMQNGKKHHVFSTFETVLCSGVD